MTASEMIWRRFSLPHGEDIWYDAQDNEIGRGDRPPAGYRCLANSVTVAERVTLEMAEPFMGMKPGCAVPGRVVPVATKPVPLQEANPKTLMGQLKVPFLSVVPPASVIYEAAALRYGAFEALRKDGSRGYGPFNWRDQPIEAMVYVDAAGRHLMSWVDGEELDRDSLVSHLAHAKATIGILIDAIENGTCIDNRPKVRKGVAGDLFAKMKKSSTTEGVK